MATTDLDLGKYKLGWSDEVEYTFKPKKGLSEEVVRDISWWKGEPDWMTEYRLRGLRHFERKASPPWLDKNIHELDFQDIFYYLKPAAQQTDEWDDLPEQMKATYEKLGIPEAERKYLAGVTAQYECLRGSTQVWTTRGMRAIKELEPGDEVFSLDESSKQIVTGRVVSVRASGVKEIFEIAADDRVIGASANHPFLASRGNGLEWTAVEQLAIGDRVAVATHARVLAGVAGPEAMETPHFGGFEAIGSIVEAGSEMTYDIEVAGHHNFVAEGFVVHNSEVVYHRNREDLEAQGILFSDMDTALREYPEIVKKWFGKIIPPGDNKLAALNTAVWSGGSFIYVPPGVNVELPLQAYFRINAENAGQFERTLIIADEGAQVHYIEGCSAPVYSSDSLHSAVVELVALPGARITYTTVQNWSPNVYNLVTKRARAEAEAHVEWVDGNIGCLAEGQRVETPNGPVAIELLTPGQEVLSYDDGAGELVWRRVVAKRYSGEQPVREVVAGDRKLRVTDNHPFLSETPDGLAFVRADRLTNAVVPFVDSYPPPRGTSVHVGAVATLERVVQRIDVKVTKHLATVPTWDIEVEGTGNFISEGFIVHNSKLTMKYPSVVLAGPKASGEVLSVAYAGAGQHQDAGAKMIHMAPETTSTIVSKSISKDGGITTYRGLVHVDEGATNSKSFVRCDALILDDHSTSNTIPVMEIEEHDARIGHEATVSKVGEDQLFYLMSRGLSEQQAMGMIVNGFIEPIVRTLPMEFAVEWSRLIELQMEGSVG